MSARSEGRLCARLVKARRTHGWLKPAARDCSFGTVGSMFGLFGKNGNNKREVPRSTADDLGAAYADGDDPAATIRNGLGEAMFAALVGKQESMDDYSYAQEFLPGIYCYLAADRNGEYHLLKDYEIPGPLDSDPFDGQLPEAPTIFHIARRATRDQVKEKFTVMGVDGTEIAMLTSGIPFGAVLATDVDDLRTITETPDYGHGQVIAMPWTNAVMIYPVKEGCSAQDLVTMSQVAMQAMQNGEQPLSPFMYWHKEGRYLPLSAVQGDQLGLNVPMEFPIARDANGQPIMDNPPTDHGRGSN